jgi:hypothetical protein
MFLSIFIDHFTISVYCYFYFTEISDVKEGVYGYYSCCSELITIFTNAKYTWIVPLCRNQILALIIVLPDMDVKDMLTQCQEVPGDIKHTTAQTESVADRNSDVTVMKELYNTHQVDYYVVNNGASGMLMDGEINNVKLENSEQTDCDSPIAPYGDSPHPVLLVQVKQELDDVDGVCTEHSDIQFPECGVSSGELTNNTYDNEVSVVGEVNDVKHEPSAHAEYSSIVSAEVEIGPHTPLPLLPVQIKEEIDDVESESITHKHYHTDNMTVHSGIKPHTCVTCSKSFTTKSYLTTHVATVHGGERRHQCGTCHKLFSTKGNLTVHITAVHDGERRYSCGTCMKSFAYKRILTDHMLVHSCINPHLCVTCSKSFTRRGNLTTHVATVHGVERRHKCGTCKALFTTKNHLNTHIDTVHRVHKCGTCHKSFYTKRNLTVHMTTVHDGETIFM